MSFESDRSYREHVGKGVARDLENIETIHRGEFPITHVFVPGYGRIIDVTQSNAWAVKAAMAHSWADEYPELFEGFDPEETPRPTKSEVYDNTNSGPFGPAVTSR